MTTRPSLNRQRLDAFASSLRTCGCGKSSPFSLCTGTKARPRQLTEPSHIVEPTDVCYNYSVLSSKRYMPTDWSRDVRNQKHTSANPKMYECKKHPGRTFQTGFRVVSSVVFLSWSSSWSLAFTLPLLSDFIITLSLLHCRCFVIPAYSREGYQSKQHRSCNSRSIMNMARLQCSQRVQNQSV